MCNLHESVVAVVTAFAWRGKDYPISAKALERLKAEGKTEPSYPVFCRVTQAWAWHIGIDSSRDPQNGWKTGERTQGGCRDSAADYRTVMCLECGRIGTYDFATD